MINVHSHASNLGSLQESQRPLPRATWGGSWSCGALCFPARCLLRVCLFPPAPCGPFLGHGHQERSCSGGVHPRLAGLPACSRSRVVSASPVPLEGSLLAPSSLPPDQGGRRRATFPPQQVPAIYLKIVANIWYNCLRKRSNKAACSSGAERASLL